MPKHQTICFKSRSKCNQHIIQDDIEIIKEGLLVLLTIDNFPAVGYLPISTIDNPQLLEALRNPQMGVLDNIGDIFQVPGFVACRLDSISSISIRAGLTIYKGRPAAITQVHIVGDSVAFPEIWFEPQEKESSSLESPDEILDYLKFWFSLFSRDLSSLNDGTNLFYVVEKSNLEQNPSSRWPDSLPKPPDEFVKLGQFGMGILAGVLGTPAKNKVEDIGFDVLEKFAKVTHFAKDNTKQALEHPIAGPLLPLIPEKVRSQFLSNDEAESLIREYESSQHYLARFSRDILTPSHLKRMRESETPLNDTTHDFDMLRKGYQSHFTGTPLTIEKWSSWHNEEGFLQVSPFTVACTVFCGGIEPQLRKELWPKILGSISWKSKRFQSLDEKETDYLSMKTNWMKILADVGDSSPVKIEFPHDGAVGDENENADELSKMTERFYRIDKDVARTDQTLDYFKINAIRSSTSSKPPPLRLAIDATPSLKRLRNVLMTYTVYNFELGYVQGMNDLCSPLLETLHDEPLTFWSYCGFMEKVAPNFDRNQTGMRNQLRQLELLLKALDPPLHDHFLQTDSSNMFCTFRWLLILFKREFPFEELKMLWEILWTCPFCVNFHLFVAVAILNNSRQELFHATAFDEVLKIINNLSHRIFVPEIIQHAEVLYYLFRDRLAIDGPIELGKSLEGQLTTNNVEKTLSEISGIARSELVLDEVPLNSRGKYLSQSEWLEVVEVLEVNAAFIST